MEEENIRWLTSLEKRGIKPGLDNIKALLACLGNPERSLRLIHVAGSDGKGSVCAMLESILFESGMKVGLFSSPHIIRINECIRVDENDITDTALNAVLDDVRKASESAGCGCTYFEALTAAALMFFKKTKTDIAVIEVGMGGRLDSTNVITPEISVINNISIEHTAYLGSDIRTIAKEKSGIMKPGVPCVTLNSGEALESIRECSEKIGSPLTVINEEDLSLVENSHDHIVAIYKNRRYKVNIPGSYQCRNLALAIETISMLKDRDSILPFANTGLESVKLHGRLEKIEGMPIIIDVTHTSCGAERTVESIKAVYGKVALVIGMLSDKNLDGVSRTMSDIASMVLVTSPKSPRAASKDLLANDFKRFHDKVLTFDTVADAIDYAMENRGDLNVLVTGSFRMAEEGYIWLQKRI